MPESDLDLLINAARKAGEIATPFWRQDPETWEKDAGAGPVTEADLAVNDMLEAQLLTARPNYGWLSEETRDNPDRLAADRVFIIDPIDGTRAFVAGDKTWAHSLAIAEQGQVTTAVIYLPLRNMMFTASAGGGAWLNGSRISVSQQENTVGATVLCPRNVMHAVHWKTDVPPFKHHFRGPLAYRLALVAQGRFDGMLTLRDTWEWDVAAGCLLVAEAGGGVSDRFGREVRFNNPHPALTGMVAGPIALRNNLSDALAS